MEKFISEKWDGTTDVTSSILDYSTSYNLFNDIHEIFLTDNMFANLRKQLFTL